MPEHQEVACVFEYLYPHVFVNVLMVIQHYTVDTEIKQVINKPKQPNIDNTLNHKQSINIYYKKLLHSNDKIDEHILKKKNFTQKMFSLPTLPKKFDLSYTTTNSKPPTNYF